VAVMGAIQTNITKQDPSKVVIAGQVCGQVCYADVWLLSHQHGYR